MNHVVTVATTQYTQNNDRIPKIFGNIQTQTVSQPGAVK